MEPSGLERVCRALAQPTSRRGVMRTGGVIIMALAAGVRLDTRSARAAPPAPPPVGEEWPACSEERAFYCIHRFEVAGVDRLAEPSDEIRLRVLASINQPEGTEVDRVEWFLNGAQNQLLDEALIGQDVLLVLRTGRLRTTFGSSWGRGFFVALAGNGDNGWEVTLRGQPALTQIRQSGGNPEQAVAAGVVCSGMLHDLTQSNPGYPDGQFITTNASGATFPVWQEGAWAVSLEAPHFAAEGTTEDGLTHASFSAWMSPANVQAMGLTVAEAAAGLLAVTRTDGGTTTPVEATVSEREGGVYIDIPDLTFSQPTLHFARKQTGPGKKSKKKKKRKKGKKRRK